MCLHHHSIFYTSIGWAGAMGCIGGMMRLVLQGCNGRVMRLALHAGVCVIEGLGCTPLSTRDSSGLMLDRTPSGQHIVMACIHEMSSPIVERKQLDKAHRAKLQMACAGTRGP